MSEPLVNIITRFSREKSIKNSLESLKSQTYNNIKHYITYETTEGLEFLKSLEYKYPTEFIRVPNLKQVDGLFATHEHHDVDTDYLAWDKEKWRFKVIYDPTIKVEDLRNSSDERIKCTVKRFVDKRGAWCVSLGHSLKCADKHFPYNLYVKIVEQQINEGWIMFLDDDDVYAFNSSVEEIVKEINDYDEDTLHIFRMKRNTSKVLPSDHYFKYHKRGHPPILYECGAGNICFHSKWKGYTVWDEWSAADFRTISSLARVIPRKNWVEKIHYLCLNGAGKGK